MIARTFAGTTYQIPESGEENWNELTDYLVALSTAATTTSMVYSSRTGITTPENVLSTDTILYMNVSGNSIVNLPTGESGRFVGIYDVYDTSGVVGGQSIVLTPASGELINGQASYTIRSLYGGVLLQYNGNNWTIISESSLDTIMRSVYRKNNATNSSVIEGGESALLTCQSVTNLQSCTITFAKTNYYKFFISTSGGQGLLCCADYATSKISAISDPSDIFLTTDVGTGIYVGKSVTSAAITIKNRTGGAINIEIHTEAGVITPTAWS